MKLFKRMCQHFFSKKETIQMANRSVKTEMVLEKLADFYLSKNAIAKLQWKGSFGDQLLASVHFEFISHLEEKYEKNLSNI